MRRKTSRCIKDEARSVYPWSVAMEITKGNAALVYKQEEGKKDNKRKETNLFFDSRGYTLLCKPS